jgi:hypothetical protein
MASNLLQYRPAYPSSIIKLDILPIKNYLDPRNLSRIPMPSPRQQAAEQKITHEAPPTERWTTSSRATVDDFDRRRCESHLFRKALAATSQPSHRTQGPDCT